jgi:steroid delta-isomerase-like uncharacterized protein
MSEANKALCRRYYEEVWNGRNLAALNELLAADFFDHDPSAPDVGRGIEGARKLVNYYLAAFPDTHFTIDDMIAEGDRCVVRWTVRGTHRGDLGGIRPTGRQVTLTGIGICRIANGKIAEAYTNWDALGMMQQLGVVQKPMAGRATA